MIGIVAIGRNEGERPMRCLRSLAGTGATVVDVDSASTDGSAARARAAGAQVVDLDMALPFTAARARNAGLAALPDVALVCGRRRERFPEASVFNRLCDMEWNTPVGEAAACGGDALMRADVVRAAGGFRDDPTAGEEPELCARLALRGRAPRGVAWPHAFYTMLAKLPELQGILRYRRSRHDTSAIVCK